MSHEQDRPRHIRHWGSKRNDLFEGDDNKETLFVEQSECFSNNVGPDQIATCVRLLEKPLNARTADDIAFILPVMNEIPFFQLLTPDQQFAALMKIKVKQLEEQETLFKQGDPSLHLYILLSGAVRLSKPAIEWPQRFHGTANDLPMIREDDNTIDEAIIFRMGAEQTTRLGPENKKLSSSSKNKNHETETSSTDKGTKEKTVNATNANKTPETKDKNDQKKSGDKEKKQSGKEKKNQKKESTKSKDSPPPPPPPPPATEPPSEDDHQNENDKNSSSPSDTNIEQKTATRADTDGVDDKNKTNVQELRVHTQQNKVEDHCKYANQSDSEAATITDEKKKIKSRSGGTIRIDASVPSRISLPIASLSPQWHSGSISSVDDPSKSPHDDDHDRDDIQVDLARGEDPPIIIEKGWAIGEQSLLENQPRETTAVVVKGPAYLLCLDMIDYHRIMRGLDEEELSKAFLEGDNWRTLCRVMYMPKTGEPLRQEDRIYKAKMFLTQSLKGERIRAYRTSQCEKNIDYVFHSKWFGWFMIIVILAHMLIVIWEPPTYRDADESRYQDVFAPLMICEYVFTSIYTFELGFLMNDLGVKGFFRGRGFLGTILVLLLWADILNTSVLEGVDLGTKAFRFSRFIRPLLLIPRVKELGRIYQLALSSLPKLTELFFVLFGVCVVYLVCGLYLFAEHSDLYDETAWRTSNSTKYKFCDGDICPEIPSYYFVQFEDHYQAFITMFTLMTTGNYPFVGFPPVMNNKLYSAFFITFLIITYFFLMNVLVSIMYAAYRDANFKVLLNDYEQSVHGLLMAFQVISCPDAGVMRYRMFETMIKAAHPSRHKYEIVAMWRLMDQQGKGYIHATDFLKIGDITELVITRQRSVVSSHHTPGQSRHANRPRGRSTVHTPSNKGRSSSSSSSFSSSSSSSSLSSSSSVEMSQVQVTASDNGKQEGSETEAQAQPDENQSSMKRSDGRDKPGKQQENAGKDQEEREDDEAKGAEVVAKESKNVDKSPDAQSTGVKEQNTDIIVLTDVDDSSSDEEEDYEDDSECRTCVLSTLSTLEMVSTSRSWDIIFNGLLSTLDVFVLLVYDLDTTLYGTIDFVCASVFTAVVIVGWLGQGTEKYFLDSWHRFDLFLVICQMIGNIFTVTDTVIPMLRFAGICRFLNVLNLLVSLGWMTQQVKGMASLSATFLRMIPVFFQMGLALVSGIFYIFAVAGMELFYDPDAESGLYQNGRCNERLNIENMPAARFCDFGNALASLFQILVTNDWHALMYTAMLESPQGRSVGWFFIVFYVICCIIMFNLLTAIFLDIFMSEIKVKMTRQPLSNFLRPMKISDEHDIHLVEKMTRAGIDLTKWRGDTGLEFEYSLSVEEGNNIFVDARDSLARMQKQVIFTYERESYTHLHHLFLEDPSRMTSLNSKLSAGVGGQGVSYRDDRKGRSTALEKARQARNSVVGRGGTVSGYMVTPANNSGLRSRASSNSSLFAQSIGIAAHAQSIGVLERTLLGLNPSPYQPALSPTTPTSPSNRSYSNALWTAGEQSAEISPPHGSSSSSEETSATNNILARQVATEVLALIKKSNIRIPKLIEEIEEEDSERKRKAEQKSSSSVEDQLEYVQEKRYKETKQQAIDRYILSRAEVLAEAANILRQSVEL